MDNTTRLRVAKLSFKDDYEISNESILIDSKIVLKRGIDINGIMM